MATGDIVDLYDDEWNIQSDLQSTDRGIEERPRNTELKSPTLQNIPMKSLRTSDGSFDPTQLTAAERANYIRCDVTLSALRQSQVEKMWTPWTSPWETGSFGEGIILKRGKQDFICEPRDLSGERDGFFDQACRLNVKVSMTVNTRVIQTYLRECNDPYIPLDRGLRLQVIPNIKYLSRCQKHHFATFVKDPPLLVVWDDDPNHIVTRINRIEEQLINLIWNGDNADDGDGKSSYVNTAHPTPIASKAPSIYGKEFPEGSAEMTEEFPEIKRQTILTQAILTAITAILILLTLGVGWRKVAIEVRVDNNWARVGLFAVLPLQIWAGWFFFHTFVNGLAQMFGPVNQITANTKSFSGLRSPRIASSTLPHVTIQCPVYKEGLWSVIDPTMMSLKAAISTYEMQGGTANVFVNDDGMQLISEAEAQERRDYYEEHNIGWVARPKHNSKPGDGEKVFLRAGRFKKASNMNYALNVSVRVEDQLVLIPRTGAWNNDEEENAYNTALARVIEEDQGRTWAEGNIRIGDYILIIDSDTRVPEDCFYDAVSEIELSPEVAIIQFSSGVMNVTQSYFEKGITFFTNLVYTAIQFAVANGDVAPFVGHNAILRWSAIQDIAYVDYDGREKFWAETTVSEDFDMALRLQSLGYTLRFGVYFKGGFKEGVSLTVYDELARWEKYAYGCSELIFHPYRYWFTKGPVTPLFRNFVKSNMSLMAKITIMSYIGTYYAIGSAWILTILNYFAIGWFNGYLDHYYIDSFKIYFSIVVVFQALGTVSLAVLRYRIEGRSLLGSFLENLSWLPLLTIFLGGASLHVSQAIFCHMFSIDMTWGATAKEAADTSFFEEIPKILRKFKFTFLFCFGMTTTMIILAGVGPVGHLIPWEWQIRTFTAIYPLAVVVTFHFLLPIVLNPGLMMFTW